MSGDFASIVPNAPTGQHSKGYKLRANNLKHKPNSNSKFKSKAVATSSAPPLVASCGAMTALVPLASPRILVVDSSSHAILKAHGLDHKQPFRSPMVRQQILEAEKRHAPQLVAPPPPNGHAPAEPTTNVNNPLGSVHSAMNVQEALEVLQRLVSQLDFASTATASQLAVCQQEPPSDTSRPEVFDRKELNARIARFVVETLRHACWQLEDQPLHMRTGGTARTTTTTTTTTTPTTTTSCGPMPLVAFDELHRGLNELILEKTRQIKNSRQKLHETIARNDALPHQICDTENEITTTIDAFTSTAAEELNLMTRNEQQVARQVTKEIQKLRKRKELRAWACNELRNALNDQMTRASELKKLITVVMNDVKREDTTYRVKAKRLEEMMVSLAGASDAPTITSSTSSSTTPTMTNGASGMELRRGVPMPGVLHKSRERVALARQRQMALQEEISKKKTMIKAKTEQIFEIRNHKKRLEEMRTELQHEVDLLADQDAHLRRSYTPRPNWDDLGRDTKATIMTIDQVEGKALSNSPSASLEPASGSSPGRFQEILEDDDDNARVVGILSNNWSTIEKVQLLERELAAARERSQSDQALAVEQIKLKHLQDEIARTLSKLHSIKNKNR